MQNSNFPFDRRRTYHRRKRHRAGYSLSTLLVLLIVAVFNKFGCNQLPIKDSERSRTTATSFVHTTVRAEASSTTASVSDLASGEATDQAKDPLKVRITAASIAPTAGENAEGSPKANQLLAPQPRSTLTAEVKRTVDGDTLAVVVDGVEAHVRLIGIDAPESVHPDPRRNTPAGKKASQYTDGHLTGKTVQLEFDEEVKDKYDRLLAYVWCDGKLYNEQIVRDGYARAKVYRPNVKYTKRLKLAEKEARRAGRGIWGNNG